MTTKLFADSNRASLYEAVEGTQNWGETPTAGKVRSRRFTQSALAVTKKTAVSDEIRADRMVSDVVETGASSGGDISWEFSAGNQDLDMQRVLMGTWSRPMEFDFFRGELLSITGPATIQIAGDDYTGYLTVGRRGKLSGFVNPANNRYVEISAVAFANGNTTITTSDALLVAEASSAFTTYQEANDVIVRASTAIRFGQTANTIDSNGANLFSDAVTAKQIVVGQRIFVEGIGYGKATVTLDGVMDNDQIGISDGKNQITFEAQADADAANADDTFFAIGVDDAHTAANFAAAVNGQRPSGALQVVATVDATGAHPIVTITNLNKAGGEVTSSDSTTAAVVDFAGGDLTVGGFYTVISAGADAIVVDRDLPTLAAGAKVTIKGTILRNPGRQQDIIPQSMTIETGFNDVSQFFVTDGLRAGGFTLDVATGAIIKGQTTTMGAATNRYSAPQLSNETTYTVLDAAATENVSATSNVGALLVNGVEVSTALKSISLKIDGSLREQEAVGSKFPVGIAAGRLNITGTLEAYFADGSNYDRFINHDTVALAFPIIDQDLNTYWITIPAFKIMSDPIAPGGNDQDVMEKLDFTAFRDATTKCMMQIDRFSSTSPITAL